MGTTCPLLVHVGCRRALRALRSDLGAVASRRAPAARGPGEHLVRRPSMASLGAIGWQAKPDVVPMGLTATREMICMACGPTDWTLIRMVYASFRPQES